MNDNTLSKKMIININKAKHEEDIELWLFAVNVEQKKVRNISKIFIKEYPIKIFLRN